MPSKLETLQRLTPKAVLQALSREAQDSVPQSVLDQGMVRISHFPFSVGRESRISQQDGVLIRTERVKQGHEGKSNDLYLTDGGRPLNISRDHFRIEQTDSGYLLIDRCSACGISVNDQHIGGRDSGGEVVLNDGDIIGVGVEGTPYTFKFITL